MRITLRKRMTARWTDPTMDSPGVATPPASPATGIGMPVRGVALGVLVRARSHPQGVPQTARCHPAGRAVRNSPSAEQDRAAGSLRGAWGLVARPSALRVDQNLRPGHRFEQPGVSLPLSAPYPPAAFAATLTFYEN